MSNHGQAPQLNVLHFFSRRKSDVGLYNWYYIEVERTDVDKTATEEQRFFYFLIMMQFLEEEGYKFVGKRHVCLAKGTTKTTTLGQEDYRLFARFNKKTQERYINAIVFNASCAHCSLPGPRKIFFRRPNTHMFSELRQYMQDYILQHVGKTGVDLYV